MVTGYSWVGTFLKENSAENQGKFCNEHWSTQRGVRGQCEDPVGGGRGVHRVPAEPIGSGFQGLKPVTAGLKSSPSSALPNSFPTTGNAPLSLWIFLHHGTHSWFHKKPLEKYLQMSNLDFILIIVIK